MIYAVFLTVTAMLMLPHLNHKGILYQMSLRYICMCKALQVSIKYINKIRPFCGMFNGQDMISITFLNCNSLCMYAHRNVLLETSLIWHFHNPEYLCKLIFLYSSLPFLYYINNLTNPTQFSFPNEHRIIKVSLHRKMFTCCIKCTTQRSTTTTPTEQCTSSNEADSVYDPADPLVIWICKSKVWTPFE